VNRKCRISVGKKRGSEAYRKGGLSLGKEGESGQEVWDICRKKGEKYAGRMDDFAEEREKWTGN
jgi:hypothetical protein